MAHSNIVISNKHYKEKINVMKETINTNEAPAAIGPYSQGIKAGGFLFLSGQIPIDPATNNPVQTNIEMQTEQVIKNVYRLLKSQGLEFSDVIKTTIFIKDMAEFAKINEIYAKYFIKDAPARSCVEVSRLPKNVLVEMEAIALLK